MNPLDEALMCKESSQLWLKGVSSSPAARAIKDKAADLAIKGLYGGAETLSKGFAIGAGTALGLGAAVGVHKLLSASQQKQVYKEMMELNPALKEEQAGDPTFFNAAYKSLKSMNPAYAKDPLVAGAMMRQMLEAGPEMAGTRLMASMRQPDIEDSGVAIEGGIGPIRIRKNI